MEEIAKTILAARRRRFLRSHPVFERSASVSEAELYLLATGLNFKFIVGLSKWLLIAGYGDIDGTLSFREDWFSILEGSTVDGFVAFARDVTGNRYAFNPKDGSIHFVSLPDQRATQISDDFPAFLRELIRRDYKLNEWMDNVSNSK